MNVMHERGSWDEVRCCGGGTEVCTGDFNQGTQRIPGMCSWLEGVLYAGGFVSTLCSCLLSAMCLKKDTLGWVKGARRDGHTRPALRDWNHCYCFCCFLRCGVSASVGLFCALLGVVLVPGRRTRAGRHDDNHLQRPSYDLAHMCSIQQHGWWACFWCCPGRAFSL